MILVAVHVIRAREIDRVFLKIEIQSREVATSRDHGRSVEGFEGRDSISGDGGLRRLREIDIRYKVDIRYTS